MRTIGKYLLLALAIILAGDCIWQITHPVKLQGFFTNDEYNLFPAEKIEKEYGSVVHERVNFEDSLYILDGTSDLLISASASKVVAYIAAKELDFIVGPREILDKYQRALSMTDLSTLVPELSPFFVYATQRDGKKAVAINLSQSMLVQGRHQEKPYFLFIPSNSSRKEETKAFLLWAFQR